MRTSVYVVGILMCAACGSNPGGAAPDAAPDAEVCFDVDLDGVTTCAGDCDDADALSYPGGNEICGDAADNNCDTQADEGCPGGIGTFVSAITGDDANPGTQASPVATIGAGLANATTIGGAQTVIVAEGAYLEKVTLVEGVDLLGGYQCDATACAWTRDPVAHAATITNVDFEGVVAGAAVTQATLVDGFTIVGRDGVPPGPPGSAGVTLAGGSPTLRGNRITGGSVTGGGFAADRSIAVALRATTDPAGAVIEGNDLAGGTSIGLSAAITIESYPAMTTAMATIRANTLRGGAARRSVGLVSWSAAPGTVVVDNDIIAGNSDGGASHGIEVGGRLMIDGNRINVDQAATGTCVNATQWCAGIFSESSTTSITNNIVFGARGARTAGVVLGEFEVAAGAVILNGNTLNGAGAGPAPTRTESAALVVTIGPCATCGFNGFVGRVRNNILDGGTNELRYGVREDPAAQRSMRVEILQNNLFWFATAAGRTDVLYRAMAGNGTPTDHTTIAAVNGLTMQMAAANVGGDPLLDATWHLGAGSPCIDAGTATEAVAADFEGDPRPAGAAVDIGHDEMP